MDSFDRNLRCPYLVAEHNRVEGVLLVHVEELLRGSGHLLLRCLLPALRRITCSLVVGEGARSHPHPQRGDMFLCLLSRFIHFGFCGDRVVFPHFLFSVMPKQNTPNKSLHLTRRERRGCNPCVPCAGSLLGRSGHGNAPLAISAASAISAREKRNAQRRRERRGPAVGIESAMDGESAPTRPEPGCSSERAGCVLAPCWARLAARH